MLPDGRYMPESPHFNDEKIIDFKEKENEGGIAGNSQTNTGDDMAGARMDTMETIKKKRQPIMEVVVINDELTMGETTQILSSGLTTGKSSEPHILQSLGSSSMNCGSISEANQQAALPSPGVSCTSIKFKQTKMPSTSRSPRSPLKNQDHSKIVKNAADKVYLETNNKRSMTMVPLAYVDRVFSEKLRKLTNETRLAKRAIKKMHNKLIDAQHSHQRSVGQLR